MSLNIKPKVAIPQNQMAFKGKEQSLKNTVKSNIIAYKLRFKSFILDNPTTYLNLGPKSSKNKFVNPFNFAYAMDRFVVNKSVKLMKSDKLIKIAKKFDKFGENVTALWHSFF